MSFSINTISESVGSRVEVSVQQYSSSCKAVGARPSFPLYTCCIITIQYIYTPPHPQGNSDSFQSKYIQPHTVTSKLDHAHDYKISGALKSELWIRNDFSGSSYEVLECRIKMRIWIQPILFKQIWICKKCLKFKKKKNYQLFLSFSISYYSSPTIHTVQNSRA